MAGGTPKLTTYRFRVWFGDTENEETQHPELVHAVGRDVQKAEEFFAQKGWGSTQNRPMTAAAVTAYFGLQRTGRFPGSWDEFEAQYLAVEPVETVTATPSEPAPAAG